MATNEVIKYNIIVDNKKALAGVKQFKTTAVGAGSAVTSAWAKAGPAMMAAGAAIGAAGVISGMKKVVGVYSDFEEQMANVSTLVDTNTVDMKKLEKQILGLSPVLGSATDNTKALYQAISAGVDPGKAVAFVGESAKAGKAGLTDALTAVEGGTTILNAFGMEAGKVTEVFDKMFTAVKAGKTTFPELSSAIGKVAPIAKSAGVSVDEMLGSVAALTKQGLKTTEAVTSLKAAFSNIIKPQGNAAKMAEELGIQFNAAGLKSKGLSGFLQDIGEKTGGNVEQMSKLFGSVEALNAVLALTSKQGGQDFKDILDGMANSAGETQTAFDKQSKTYKTSVATLKNSMEKVGVAIGSKVAPELAKAAVAIADWLEASMEAENSGLNQFIETASTLWGLFKDIIVALSPILKVVAIAFQGIGAAIKIISAVLSPLLKLLQSLLDILAGGIQWLTGWVKHLGFIGDAIGAVVGILPGMGDGIDNSTRAMTQFGQETKNISPEIRKLANDMGTLNYKALKKAADITEDWLDDSEDVRDSVNGWFSGQSDIDAMAKKFGELRTEMGMLGVNVPDIVDPKNERSVELYIKNLEKLAKLAKKGLKVNLQDYSTGENNASNTVEEVKKAIPKAPTVKVEQAQISLMKKVSEDALFTAGEQVKAQMKLNRLLKKEGELRQILANFMATDKATTIMGGMERGSMNDDIKSVTKDVKLLKEEMESLGMEVNIKFTGEGSTVLPLSEKIEEMKGKMSGFSDGVDEANPTLKVAFQDMAGQSLTTALSATERGFNTMYDSIIAGTFSVRDSFQSMAADILQSIGKMLASQAISSFVGMLGGSIMGAFSGGGGVGTAPTHVGAQGTTAFGMAGGGSIGANQPRLIGEKGPEIFMPKTSGSVIPNSQIGGGGGSLNVVNNISVESSGDKSADNKQANDIARAIDEKINKQIATATRPGGILNPTRNAAMGAR